MKYDPSRRITTSTQSFMPPDKYNFYFLPLSLCEYVTFNELLVLSEAGAITRTFSLLLVRHCFTTTAVYGSPSPHPLLHDSLVGRGNFVAEWPCFLIAR